jgi:hypothetical protein
MANNDLEFDLSKFQCPDIDSFIVQGHSTSEYRQTFGLRVDTCTKLAKNPETECESAY